MTRTSLRRTAALCMLLTALGCQKPAEPTEPAPEPEETAPAQQAPSHAEPEPAAPATPTEDPAEPTEPGPAEVVDANAAGEPEPGPAEPPEKTRKPKPRPERPRKTETDKPASPAPEKAQPEPTKPPPAKPALFKVQSGSASFLIDAPLEKIKGTWSGLSGELTVNPANLLATRGEVTVPLKTLKTNTFGSASQNATQTKHALNWMEVDDKADYAVARFRIERVTLANPKAVSAGAEVQVKLSGRLRLHGIESQKQVQASVSFSGDPAKPSGLTVKTQSPLRVSLKKHDIKPRDLAGRFLAGAMDQIGQKIADVAQVHIQFKAAASGVPK